MKHYDAYSCIFQINTSRQLSEKLNRLQERLQDQMDINEQLIREIEQQKEHILKGIAKFKNRFTFCFSLLSLLF